MKVGKGQLAVLILAAVLAAGLGCTNLRQSNQQKLFKAVGAFSSDQVEQLIGQGADVSAVNPEGQTPLLYLSRQFEKEFLAAMFGKTATASQREKYERIVSQTTRIISLLAEAGADIKARDRDNLSALDYCRLNAEVSALLIKLGAEPYNPIP